MFSTLNVLPYTVYGSGVHVLKLVEYNFCVLMLIFENLRSSYNIRKTTIHDTVYVTWHEKTGLMYTKYTCSYKTEYLHYCTSYLQSVS